MLLRIFHFTSRISIRKIICFNFEHRWHFWNVEELVLVTVFSSTIQGRMIRFQDPFIPLNIKDTMSLVNVKLKTIHTLLLGSMYPSSIWKLLLYSWRLSKSVLYCTLLKAFCTIRSIFQTFERNTTREKLHAEEKSVKKKNSCLLACPHPISGSAAGWALSAIHLQS